MVCTFFGHKDTPSSAAKALEQMLEYLITEKQADFVVTYVKYTAGGAVKYKMIAEKAGKTVFNLA